MAITSFMNLDLPTVSVTLGPEWASDLNEALELIDSHDHTSGKGKPVPTAGIDINANLEFNGFKALELKSTQYDPQGSTLTGASNAGSVFIYLGNLYYTNSSGTAVQITSGGSVVSTPADVQSLETTSINTNLTISPSDTFVLIYVDTSASRTIDLPLASSVVAGRFYAIKDTTGTQNAFPTTIATQGGDLLDGEASLDFDSNFGCTWVSTDGVSNWYVI